MMRCIVVLVFGVLLTGAGTTCCLSAQEPNSVASPAQHLDSLQAVSDSLRMKWQSLWRASDSLRIHSVLLRMKADSLSRWVTATRKKQQAIIAPPTQRDTTIDVDDSSSLMIIEALALEAAARTAQASFNAKSPKKGATLSDSITYYALSLEPDTGIASYYAEKFHGKRMSNGEVYNMNDLTCAHRWLPFGTLLEVTNLDNGNHVVVRVTDRGPFKHTRIIDVSKGAAVSLGMIRAGTARVHLRVHIPTESEDSDTTNKQ